MPKSFAQRIKAYEEDVLKNKNAIHAIIEATKGAEGEDALEFTAEQQATVDLAKENIEKAQANIATLKAAESGLAAQVSVPAVKGGKPAQEKERPQADLFFKRATVALIAHEKRVSVDAAAEQVFAKDSGAIEFIKSTVEPARTDVAGWAQELIQEQYGEFLEALRPVSIYAQLLSLGTTIPFNGSNSVVFPAEGTTGGLAGKFVGEGNLIPVGKGNFTTVTLARYKMAVITSFTREILRSSTPQIEALVRSSILKDTAEAIDAALLDANPAVTGIRPAGLLNNVTPVASSGTTIANIVTDVKALVSPIIAAGGSSAGIVFLMNDEHLLGLNTAITAAGTFAFRAELSQGTLLGYKVIASSIIPKGVVHAVYAPALASAVDMPEFETSNSAVIIQANEDGTKPVVSDYDRPADGNTVGAAASDSTNNPMITTAFQQDLTVLRMVMPLAWGLRRANMVTSLSGVAW